MKNKNLLIVDGTFLLFKSFYGISKSKMVMKNSEGIKTGAIHLFFSTFFKVIQKFNITNFVIAFDAGKKTYRHKVNPQYKANRKPIEDDLIEQILLLKKISQTFNLPFFENENYEADDIIASVCKQEKENYRHIYIFSADSDLFQLIEPKISVIKTYKNEFLEWNWENFVAKEQILPSQILDYKALVGDKSDNIIGVNKIGKKTAIKIIKEFKSLDLVFANVKKLKSQFLRNTILENKDLIFFNKNIIKLTNDIKIDLESKNSSLSVFNSGLGIELIEKLELKNVKNTILKFLAK